jgi:hypothetical protein
MVLAVQKRLTALDAAGSLTEDGHLEIFILQIWGDFQHEKKTFEESAVKAVIKTSKFFADLCEKMFNNVWKKVNEFLDDLEE